MIIKRIVPFIVVLAVIGCVGCGQTAMSSMNEQEKLISQSVENDSVANETKDEKNEEETLGKQSPQYALKLEITPKQRKEFIKTYGKDKFEIANYWALGCFQMERYEPSKEVLEQLQKDYTVEELKIESSYDGHHIPADYVLANGNKDADTVILLHGYTCTRRTMPELEMDFLKKGYNVLAIDMAGAGENDCELSTYGAYEQYEVLDCVHYVRKEMSSDKKIILCGCSYGGGVAGVCLGNKEINTLVDAVILDCPVGDFRQNIIAHVEGCEAVKDEALVAEYHVYFDELDRYAQMMYGFSLDDTCAAKCAKHTTLPVLIFTSKIDDNVPMEQPMAIYNAIPHEKKYIKIFDNVPHVSGWCMEETRAEYQQIIDDFLAGKLYE